MGIKEPLPHLCLFSMSQDEDRELSEALARSAESTARDARIAARVAAQARIAARVASQARAREPEPAGVVGLVGEASLSWSQSAPAVSPLSEETPAGVVGLVGYASLSGSQSAPSVSTISEEMPPLEGENIAARALRDAQARSERVELVLTRGEESLPGFKDSGAAPGSGEECVELVLTRGPGVGVLGDELSEAVVVEPPYSPMEYESTVPVRSLSRLEQRQSLLHKITCCGHTLDLLEIGLRRLEGLTWSMLDESVATFDRFMINRDVAFWDPEGFLFGAWSALHYAFEFFLQVNPDNHWAALGGNLGSAVERLLCTVFRDLMQYDCRREQYELQMDSHDAVLDEKLVRCVGTFDRCEDFLDRLTSRGRSGSDQEFKSDTTNQKLVQLY